MHNVTNFARGMALLLGGCALTLVATAAAQANGGNAAAQALAQGSALTQRGDFAGAEAAFRRAIADAPKLAEAYLGLGLVQLREGQIDGASSSLQRASTLNPHLEGPHLFLGIAQYQTGQSEAASKNLRAEIALRPDNLEALTWLGIVGLGSDHPEQAVAPLDQAAALKPNDPQILYYEARAHQLMAEAALRRLYQIDPDSALVHRASAENYAGSGSPEKAIAEYQLALAKQPGDADLLEALGEQQQKLSRFDDASQTYGRELTLNPNSAVALYNLGKIDVDTGKPKEGVALLRQAVAAHARPAPVDYSLGRGLAELGQDEEAARWLEESLAKQPSPFVEQGAYFQLARVYGRLNRKEDAQRAVAKLKQLKAQVAPGAESDPATAPPESGNPP